MSRLVDPSPGTGVCTGDLRYGRCNGNTPVKNKDFAGEDNQPISRVVLVSPRDPQVWRRDDRVKKFRNKSSSQFAVNYLIESYCSAVPTLRSNITLKIGKQRI